MWALLLRSYREETEVQRGEGTWPRLPARTGRGSERQSQVLPPGVLYMGSSFCLERSSLFLWLASSHSGSRPGSCVQSGLPWPPHQSGAKLL